MIDMATPSVAPFFSVIVPVRNGARHLRRALRGVHGSSFRDWELIVVDDGSEDGSDSIARALGAQVVCSGRPQGAAAARNLGARHARGRFLLFLDADCEPHADTLELVARELDSDPSVDGVFGSYDDSPADPRFTSQFKNLFHHYVHQRSRERAATFWTGCGAIRRSTFLELGGFDPEQRMLEDVELGLRLRRAGGRLRLSKEVRVKHLKGFTFVGLVRSDVFDRAIPWARLIVERDGWIDDLNLCRRDRWSAALTFGLVACLGLTPLQPLAAGVGVSLAGLLVAFNRDFYGFLRRRRGVAFTLGAVPLHWLYFAYSSLGLGVGLGAAALGTIVRRREAGLRRGATTIERAVEARSLAALKGSVRDAAA